MILDHDEYLKIDAYIRPNGQAFIYEKFCDGANGEKFEIINQPLDKF